MVRELHVVGLSRDGRHLMLAASAGGRASYQLATDQRLHRALRGDPLDGEVPGPALTPKDIQARLRAGASVEDVAREAGLPPARIERYAGPVLSERERLLSAVAAAVLVRPRLGRSQLPLGQSVQAQLDRTANVRPGSASWTAYRREDGVWVARLEVVVRGRTKRAEWSYDTAARQVQALDSYAAALGYVEPGPAGEGSPVARSKPRRPAPRSGGPTPHGGSRRASGR